MNINFLGLTYTVDSLQDFINKVNKHFGLPFESGWYKDCLIIDSRCRTTIEWLCEEDKLIAAYEATQKEQVINNE